jgi:hypothetical protein
MDIMVNYFAVVVAAIAAFVIGFLWHGPVFGKQWMKLSNITEADVAAAKNKSMMPQMVAAFVQQLVMAYVLAHFVIVWSVADLLGAATLAFWIWLGFIATVLLNGVLWEKRTVPLYLFNIVYHLVSLFAMTAILGLWR